MSGDDPWQVLACCMEIANAVHSENPDAYISHLPVHQVQSLKMHITRPMKTLIV